MKEIAKHSLGVFARAVPLAVFGAFIKRDCIVLCYHTVSEKPLPHIQHYPYKTPRDFENDILYLQRHYNLISYGELLAHARDGTRLKPRAVLLTFDDGLSQCYSVVRPILKKHAAPCVFFITTDLVDNRCLCVEHKTGLCIDNLRHCAPGKTQGVLDTINRITHQNFVNRESCIDWMLNLDCSQTGLADALCGIIGINSSRYLAQEKPYLTREEIRALAAEGFTIGSHGREHVRLDLVGAKNAEAEIAESAKTLTEWLTITSVPFAFPYHGQFVRQEFLKQILKKYSFIDIFFNTAFLRKGSNFLINRVWADNPKHAYMHTTNLPLLLKEAYMDCAVDFFRKKR